MPITLNPLTSQFVDGENIAVELDVAYAFRGDEFARKMALVLERHGASACLLPLSAQSGGSGIFQVSSASDGDVVGIRIEPTALPKTSHAAVEDITAVALDEIVIDVERQQVCAGSSVTLEQLNQVIGESQGPRFKVLGADLTSYTYAQVGATFMTGGMGPQRRFFSDSVTEISLFDGNRLRPVSGEELAACAGTYGWTGIVTAVRCNYVEFPDHEIAFALPVSNSPQHLARLLQRISAFAYVDTIAGKLHTTAGRRDLVLGVEHVTTDAMGPLLAQQGETATARRASGLAQKCRQAGADGLVFISAWSDRPAEDFLFDLVDDGVKERPAIAGIDLEHTELFDDPDEMRQVREAIPFAARTQTPPSRFVFKNHTDANIRLAPDRVETAMKALWQHNRDYVASIRDWLDRKEGVDGEVLVYGHLNPSGVDPHNRVTLWSDDESAYEEARAMVHDRLGHYLRELKFLCENTGSGFIGGEKSAASDRETCHAIGGLDQLPASLAQRIERQRNLIKQSSPLFRWRALPPFN